MDNKIYFYGEGFKCLSNFAAYQVLYNDRQWMTAEHAYQAQKFTDKDIQDLIYQCPSAYAAKDLARQHKDLVPDNWHEINVSIMKEILSAKLEQHQHIREKLRSSGDKELIEDSDDQFWGRGRDKNGKNQLGKLWMQLRNEIK